MLVWFGYRFAPWLLAHSSPLAYYLLLCWRLSILPPSSSWCCLVSENSGHWFKLNMQNGLNCSCWRAQWLLLLLLFFVTIMRAHSDIQLAHTNASRRASERAHCVDWVAGYNFAFFSCYYSFCLYFCRRC